MIAIKARHNNGKDGSIFNNKKNQPRNIIITTTKKKLDNFLNYEGCENLLLK